MSKTLLKELFSKLNNENINYVVLRGFEKLPDQYTNDIDFGLLRQDGEKFTQALKSVAYLFNYKLIIRDLRLDVRKLSFSNGSSTIDIDVWFSFNYAGLYYLNSLRIITDYKTYNDIRVLKPENELSLSFLKELLHMSRLRKDKIGGLQNKLDSPYTSPLSVYFTSSDINEFILNIQNSTFDLKKISRRAKLRLLFTNANKHGVLCVLWMITYFHFVKYTRFFSKRLIQKQLDS